MSKLVYIAGPYRAPTPWGVEQNIRNAMDAAVMVWRAGLWALCPHANTARMEDMTSDESFLAGAWGDASYCDDILRDLGRMPGGYRVPAGGQDPASDGFWLGRYVRPFTAQP